MISVSSARATGYDLDCCAPWTLAGLMSTREWVSLMHQGIALRAYW